jgi:hypothetical protein
MTTEQFIIQYVQTSLFLLLGVRSYLSWKRSRDDRARHLALATGLFALNSLIGAINATLFQSAQGEVVPDWDRIVSSTITYVYVYFFFRFLADFVRFPKWVEALFGLATVAGIVLGAIEKPDFRFDPEVGLIPIPGVENPIDYKAYVGYVLLYLALAFGLMFITFLVFGLKGKGLARFRMLMISGGFFLLFVVIGLIPRLLFGSPSPETIQDVLAVVRYIALGSAPLLLIGFAPPRWVIGRFNGSASN